LCGVGAAEAEGVCAEVILAAGEFAAGDVDAVDVATAVLGFGGEVPGFGDGGLLVVAAAAEYYAQRDKDESVAVGCLLFAVHGDLCLFAWFDVAFFTLPSFFAVVCRL